MMKSQDKSILTLRIKSTLILLLDKYGLDNVVYSLIQLVGITNLKKSIEKWQR